MQFNPYFSEYMHKIVIKYAKMQCTFLCKLKGYVVFNNFRG